MNGFTLSFKSLPVWRGVQHSPVFEAAPFSLCSDGKNYIRQSTDQQILQQIESAYSSKRYSFITNPPGYSAWSTKLGMKYISYAEDTISSFTGKSILEIGAGSLFIASYFTERYDLIRYVVIDPAVREKIPRGSVIEILPKYFRAEYLSDMFDIVMSFNTLEHVSNPKQFLLDIKQVLKVDGLVLLVFPDASDQFKRGDFNVLMHEHINYFTPSSATTLFGECGFRVLDYRIKEETLFFLLKVGRGSRIMEDESENISRLVESVYRKNIMEIPRQVRQELDLGKKIAFHGACNGSNNFLFLGKIANSQNLFIFDGDETKEGKYLPVFSKPILNAGDPLYQDCDLVYIAALTYFAEIREFLLKRHNFLLAQVRPLFPLERGAV